ncbi:MAG: P22 phage major capsid protein family protein [Methanoregula sp.]
MTVNNFIPTIWSGQVFTDFQKATVLGSLCNRDYEGDITGQGDKVKITKVGPVTIRTYTKNSTSNLTVETLNDSQTQLEITEAKYFAFSVDDIDAVQAKGNVLGAGMMEASQGLAEDADSFLAALYTQAGASTYMSLTQASTDYGVLTMFGRANQLLSEMNCPKAGRKAYISPFVSAQLVKQNVMLTQGLNSELFVQGYLGRFMGFDIYESNNLATGSTHATANPVQENLFGTNAAITFADQIIKTEAYRPEGGFSDAVKGLHVYGAKVIQPKALVVIETRST